MIALKNIERKNGIISADYYPEAETVGGFISVDMKSGEIVDVKSGNAPWSVPAVCYHGRKRLLELSKKKELPKESTVMWY